MMPNRRKLLSPAIISKVTAPAISTSVPVWGVICGP